MTKKQLLAFGAVTMIASASFGAAKQSNLNPFSVPKRSAPAPVAKAPVKEISPAKTVAPAVAFAVVAPLALSARPPFAPPTRSPYAPDTRRPGS